MPDETLPLLTDAADTLPLHVVRPDGLAALLAALPPSHSAFLTACGFAALPSQLVLLPGESAGDKTAGGASGIGGAVFGLGEDRAPHPFGDLPYRLPAGTAWRLEPGDFAPEDAVLGFCLGAYVFRRFKTPKREPARLLAPAGCERGRAAAMAAWMVRDLVNTPANLLGPSDLADAAIALGEAHGASCTRIEGAALEEGYPAVASVGRGSARPPVVAAFAWRGSAATDDSPLVSLCGKGVVFDTGGYDLKPSAAMLRMKKDMGGAATVLGLARMLMDADLPIRLAVRVGCVENSVSGTAMRPSDVIRTRRGLTVEIGNTDAEGRLVLADLLAEASDEHPSLLIDCATLTGAARVAVGPDLPALFCTDDELSSRLVRTGARLHDPVWPLPLWDGYAGWLDSAVADLNNVATKPFAGAVTAALFLRRFVAPGTRWIHLDLYAWNDQSRPGRPEGGEAQAMRALAETIEDDAVVMRADRNSAVTSLG